MNNIFIPKSKSEILEIISTFTFKEKYNLLTNNQIQHYILSETKYDFSKIAYDKIPQRLRSLCGWSNFSQVFDRLSKEEYNEINSLVEQYIPLLLQEQFTPSDTFPEFLIEIK